MIWRIIFMISVSVTCGSNFFRELKLKLEKNRLFNEFLSWIWLENWDDRTYIKLWKNAIFCTMFPADFHQNFFPCKKFGRTFVNFFNLMYSFFYDFTGIHTIKLFLRCDSLHFAKQLPWNQLLISLRVLV